MLTIWIHSTYTLIIEILTPRLQQAGFKVETGPLPPSGAEVALWDLRRTKPPYPLPPELPTLALIEVAHADAKDKISLLSVGYQGYLSGEESPGEFARAFKAVLSGEMWAERKILTELVREQKASQLTNREQQVLDLLLLGLSNKQIAQRLGISEKTVKVYVSGLLSKLNAKSRMDLALSHRKQISLGRLAGSSKS